MPASWRTFTHAARHCSSVPYSCSNSASVSPGILARIARISCPSESILHRFYGGCKGGDWLISGNRLCHHLGSVACVHTVPHVHFHASTHRIVGRKRPI